MNTFKNAENFFHNCESAKGWGACQSYVADNATFNCQSKALIEVKDVKTYVDWIEGLSTVTMPGCTYSVHASAYDEANKQQFSLLLLPGHILEKEDLSHLQIKQQIHIMYMP